MGEGEKCRGYMETKLWMGNAGMSGSREKHPQQTKEVLVYESPGDFYFSELSCLFIDTLNYLVKEFSIWIFEEHFLDVHPRKSKFFSKSLINIPLDSFGKRISPVVPPYSCWTIADLSTFIKPKPFFLVSEIWMVKVGCQNNHISSHYIHCPFMCTQDNSDLFCLICVLC